MIGFIVGMIDLFCENLLGYDLKWCIDPCPRFLIEANYLRSHTFKQIVRVRAASSQKNVQIGLGVSNQ